MGIFKKTTRYAVYRHYHVVGKNPVYEIVVDEQFNIKTYARDAVAMRKAQRLTDAADNVDKMYVSRPIRVRKVTKRITT